jgi:hypothetical protein
MIAFNQWLRVAIMEETLAGDVIEDLVVALINHHLPPLRSLDDLIAYLRVERLASPDAVGAAPIVWSRFTNYLIWGMR